MNDEKRSALRTTLIAMEATYLPSSLLFLPILSRTGHDPDWGLWVTLVAAAHLALVPASFALARLALDLERMRHLKLFLLQWVMVIPGGISFAVIALIAKFWDGGSGHPETAFTIFFIFGIIFASIVFLPAQLVSTFIIERRTRSGIEPPPAVTALT